ncbi:hypothetical protein HYD_1970 [Candidatus Hydrogenosomobacter endosymbioticus]|uniref:Uncharacterized protein n=2 Tax=Candidatus Hydrogenosomobacter endosymbioticus TaxID=2558174 RepID=A0ABN6L2H0_9PROT|nr:hypothetical protein HYD_1970 [Candidatus Hydrogenosomobacter endosymbioticus]
MAVWLTPEQRHNILNIAHSGYDKLDHKSKKLIEHVVDKIIADPNIQKDAVMKIFLGVFKCNNKEQKEKLDIKIKNTLCKIAEFKEANNYKNDADTDIKEKHQNIDRLKENVEITAKPREQTKMPIGQMAHQTIVQDTHPKNDISNEDEEKLYYIELANKLRLENALLKKEIESLTNKHAKECEELLDKNNSYLLIIKQLESEKERLLENNTLYNYANLKEMKKQDFFKGLQEAITTQARKAPNSRTNYYFDANSSAGQRKK